MTGSEFQTVGTIKLNERSPKPFKFLFGIFSRFSLDERRRDRDVWYVDRYRGIDPSKCRLCKSRVLVLRPEFHGQPVQLFEKRYMPDIMRSPVLRYSRGRSHIAVCVCPS